MKKEHNEYLDAYYAGETSFEDLPPSVRAEEGRIVDLLRQLPDERSAPASLRRDVMERIGRLPRSRWEDLVNWYFRPRTIRLSPAMATVATVVGLAVYLLLPRGGSFSTSQNDGESGAYVMTRFVFVAPEAKQVTVTGDWVGWDVNRLPLKELRGSGVWTADIPVPPGVHEYSFILDGTEWRPDPLAGSQVDDGFGRTNSVVMVSTSQV